MKERALTWLVEAYHTQGKLEFAEALLSEALAEDPTNETLLCHLMQTLHEEGMTHQALRAYDAFVKALGKVELEPAEATTALYQRLKRAPRLVTLPQPSQLPAQQAEREPFPALQEIESEPALVREERFGQQTEPPLLFPDRVSRTAWLSHHHRALDLLSTMPAMFSDGEEPGAYFALGASNLGALLERGWTIDALIEVLQVILPVVKSMPMMTRSMFLQAGAATAMLGGFPLSGRKQISEEETAQFCQALNESIAAGWKLFTQGKNAQALAVSQAQLALLHSMSAALPINERPALYASVYNFLGMALHIQKQYHEALHAHNNAYLAASSTGDALCVAYSLLGQADDYFGLGHYQRAMNVVEQAHRTLGALDEPPLHLQAHLLGVWADSAMMAGDYEMAREKLDTIAALLDNLSPNDEFDRASWYQLSGKYAYLNGDYAAAARYCEQSWQELSEASIIRRALALMPWLSANACMRDLDASLIVLEMARQIIPALQAPAMNQPLQQGLQGFLIVFPHETRVKTIVSELVQHLH
jgi:tetratricopeptide (TPR) repeat protein